MRNTLYALTNELKRLKAAGVHSVSVDASGIDRLRLAITQNKKLSQQTSTARPSPKLGDIDEYSKQLLGNVEPGSLLPIPPKIKFPEGDKKTRWQALRELVINDEICLKQVRPGMPVVFGVGDIDAKVMFVGEAPGAEEETSGEPFVGPAGQLLTKMIGAMGLSRETVYIGNIMKWRPQIIPNSKGGQICNRPPTLEEMQYCLPFLSAQIEIVDPQLIVALGSTAAHGLLGDKAFATLGEVRGKWHEFGGKPLMVTYHPSYILRNKTNRSKRMIWEDLLLVMERVSLPISDKQRGFFLNR